MIHNSLKHFLFYSMSFARSFLVLNTLRSSKFPGILTLFLRSSIVLRIPAVVMIKSTARSRTMFFIPTLDFSLQFSICLLQSSHVSRQDAKRPLRFCMVTFSFPEKSPPSLQQSQHRYHFPDTTSMVPARKTAQAASQSIGKSTFSTRVTPSIATCKACASTGWSERFSSRPQATCLDPLENRRDMAV